MDCQTLTVEEAGRVLGISRSLAYEAARRGEIPVIRIGKRYLVLKVQLEQILAGSGKRTREPIAIPSEK
jgi:excisionase family DNA binding protein